MKHFIGLDVSVKETAVCIIDESGKICREVKVVSHPDDLIAALKGQTWNVERIGLEAGPLSQWLFEGLARAGLPVICIETRHVKAFLKAQPNKTDRNDARGIAQMMRVNLYRPVHVKTLTSQSGGRSWRPASCCRKRRSPSRTTSAAFCAFWAEGWRRGHGEVRRAHSRAHRRHARSRGNHGATACRPREAAYRICAPPQTSSGGREG